MHRTRNADHAGEAPAGGSFSNGGRDVTASIRSCEDRRAGAAPVGLPISQKTRAMPKSSRRRLANPLLPGASPGARSISGPSSNSKTTQWHCVDRGAIPRDSTNSSRARGRQQSTPLGAVSHPGQHRGARPFSIAAPAAMQLAPAINGALSRRAFRQSVESDARHW